MLENPSHTPQRRRVSVAHELGRFLLAHDFATSAIAEGGREFNEVQEKPPPTPSPASSSYRRRRRAGRRPRLQ